MSDTIAATYVHQPLSGDDAIHVLVLHLDPDPEAELQCSLRKTFIGGSTEAGTLQYVALSYTWGKPEFTRRLWCDDHVFWITANLDQALRRIRELATASLVSHRCSKGPVLPWTYDRRGEPDKSIDEVLTLLASKKHAVPLGADAVSTV